VAQLYAPTIRSLVAASDDSQGYGGGIITRLHTGYSVPDVKANVILRSMVSRLVRPDVRLPSRTRDQIFPSLFNYFRQLRCLMCDALSDERSGL
jgi:hypothetical protein